MAGLFGGSYSNLDDAAAAALWVASQQPRVRKQEYMTLLVQDPATGKIRREAFQTQGNQRSSEWTGIPNGKVLGVVHTHPQSQAGDRYPSTSFSGADVKTATDMGLPSYIAAIQAQGPSQDRKYVQQGNRQPPGPQQGQEFLAQIPIDEYKMMIAIRIKNSNMAPALKARLLQNLFIPAEMTAK